MPDYKRKIFDLSEGKLTVGTYRRVKHSAKYKVKALMGDKDSKLADTILVGTNASSNAMGGVNTVASWAVVLGSTTAVAAALTAPALSAIAGTLAISALAMSMYSNRDKAHNELAGYVWSFVHKKRPHRIRDDKKGKKVKAAAMALVMDENGQRQFQKTKQKLALTKYIAWRHALSYSNQYENEEHLQKLIDEAFEPRGAVYEYIRRLNHTANYLQAHTICSEVFRRAYDETCHKNIYLKDLPKGLKVSAIREEFEALARELNDYDNRL